MQPSRPEWRRKITDLGRRHAAVGLPGIDPDRLFSEFLGEMGLAGGKGLGEVDEVPTQGWARRLESRQELVANPVAEEILVPVGAVLPPPDSVCPQPCGELFTDPR